MNLTALIRTLRAPLRARPAPGSAPGTLVPHEDLPAATLHRFAYSGAGCSDGPLSLAELEAGLQREGDEVVWIDVQGLGDAAAVTAIGQVIGLHPLTLEDVVHVHQRPKVEAFDDYLFIVLRGMRLTAGDAVDSEQISLLLKEGLLVTFQERPGDGFDPVRRRLREGLGTIRRAGADHLAYALIDAAIDNYFPVLERYVDGMDDLEEQVLERPTQQTAGAIHAIRRQLRAFRRTIWPLREVVAALGRNDLPQISRGVQPSFRDCHDHVIQVADFVESSRERASDLVDLYLSSVSDRTNQVMKVLTIIATIFIPLTFLAGLYGMNFSPDHSPYNMPELRWRYGYPAFWGLLLLVLAGMLWFFRRKGWLGGQGSVRSDRQQRTDDDEQT